MPLGVCPYRPASRLPKGRNDPAFPTKPPLAWQLIQEARAAHIPFRLVVADSIYGESSDREAKLYAAQIPSIMGLRPAHGTWQFVEDAQHPPAFTPAEAAQRLPAEAWQRTGRYASPGKELVRDVAALALGSSYGPDKGVRFIAATVDPTQLKPASTWYLATSFPLAQVSAEQVYELYRLRDWIEHFYKPVKHELGWADYQVGPEQAIVRHWHLVLLADTFRLLVGAGPWSLAETAAGGKIGADQRRRVRGARRARREPVARHLEPGVTAGAGMAVPVGTAAARLDALVACRPATRAGRAARPRRALPPAAT